MSTAILLVSCPDQKGITARITDFIFKNNGNIEHADQHIDTSTSLSINPESIRLRSGLSPECNRRTECNRRVDSQSNTFFMRVEWSLADFAIVKEKISKEFTSLAEEFNIGWNLYFSSDIPRMAVFASGQTHCLYDLLLKQKQGLLKCRIPLIVSNHSEVSEVAKSFGIKFFHFPKTAENKKVAERKEIELLKKENIELIVLARYTQILTNQFVKEFPNRIINIHHSFLPAFIGSKPYQRAYSRGVKIIGATSHYVTDELDAGPIIEQDIVRVNHRCCLEDLKREGRELERIVLNRAIRWHLERKILIYNNKTVVFD